jgi:predicted acetyltransferase
MTLSASGPDIAEMETSILKLRPLLVTDEFYFRRALDEFKEKEPEWPFAFHFDDSMAFVDYVRRLDCWSKGKALPVNFVPNTFLVGDVDKKIVGRVSIRHELNDYLSKYGGHVGYGVVPSQRNRGYASQMLKLTIPIATQLDIARILVTCDENNRVSRKIIEKTGGMFENVMQEPGTGVLKRRYWIQTSGPKGPMGQVK